MPFYLYLKRILMFLLPDELCTFAILFYGMRLLLPFNAC